MKDSELKKNTTYWAEIIDPDLKELNGKQLKVKFTGIYFREIDEQKTQHMKMIFLLSQIKIFRVTE